MNHNQFQQLALKLDALTSKVDEIQNQLKKAARRQAFKGSAQYWEDRYAGGGNSGKGSYGLLADYKARVINEFVRSNDVASVMEFGCGDGNQLKFAEYPRYAGYDVSATAVTHCRHLFANDGSKSFALVTDYVAETADLSMSLDVLFHLVEDTVFNEYMNRLFDSAQRFVIIYSSNFDRTETDNPHVRHRAFSEWVERRRPDFKLTRIEENAQTMASKAAGQNSDRSPADFFFYERLATP